MSPLRTTLLVFAALTAVSAAQETSDRIVTVYSALQRNELLLNNLVDGVVRWTNRLFLELGRDQVRMPDNSFDVDRFTVGLTDAWVGRMSTLQRTSNATADMQANTVVIAASFGLQELAMTSKLSVTSKYGFPSINRQGNIDVTVGTNSIYMEASIQVTNEACKFGVDLLKVRKLADIKATVSNFGIMNFPLNTIINRHLDGEDIGKQVQAELDRVVQALRMSCQHLIEHD